ncbi:MAG: hypothetical protein PWR08_1807 [Thermoanaerobacterium sp.]|jgi:hypothetical protein|nr:hypothetical protein [Thermoanaerobacterium sp.]MDN5317682.1 hypothetical protein [Thermoanaerobacterium sp.]
MEYPRVIYSKNLIKYKDDDYVKRDDDTQISRSNKKTCKK